MDTLCIFAHDRPYELYRCLRSVEKADLTDVRVILSEDRVGFRSPLIEREMEECIQDFKFPFRHIQWGDTVYGYAISATLHQATLFSDGSELVAYLEDDHLMESGMFPFLRKVFDQYNPFVCAPSNVFTPWSQDPAEVGISYSKFTTTCAMRAFNWYAFLRSIPWTDHFEVPLHNRIIENKLSTMWPTMPRAFEQGAAGRHQPARPADTTFRNPPTPETLRIGVDLRDRWERDYEAQKRWGF